MAFPYPLARAGRPHTKNDLCQNVKILPEVSGRKTFLYLNFFDKERFIVLESNKCKRYLEIRK